jgi:hypothetical protein
MIIEHNIKNMKPDAKYLELFSSKDNASKYIDAKNAIVAKV